MDNQTKNDEIQSRLQEMENEFSEDILSVAYDEIIESLKDIYQLYANAIPDEQQNEYEPMWDDPFYQG